MSIKLKEVRTGEWVYHLYFRWPSGNAFRERKLVPVSDLSKTKARAWVESRKVHLLSEGEHALREAERKDVPTFEAFAPRYHKEWLIAEKKKPRTIDEYMRVIGSTLNPVFGPLRLDEIRAAEVQSFKGECIENELDEKTVNNYLTVLNQVLKFGVLVDAISAMPCTIRKYKVTAAEMRRYEEEVYQHLLATAAGLDPRSHALVLMGGDAGLRRGEMVALEWDDCEFRRNVLHVRRSESNGHVTLPKGGRARDIDMSDALRAALEKLKARRDPRQRRVLVRDPSYRWDKKQGPVDGRTLQSWMERVETHAEMPVTGGIHILRHTFCSRLAERGATLLEIKELAGHADVTTTARYMHLAPNKKESAIARLNAPAARDAAPPEPPSSSKDGETRGSPVAKEKGPVRTPVLSAV